MVNRTPGGMVLKEDVCALNVEYALSIPCNHNSEDDELIINDYFNCLCLKLTNCYTNEKRVEYFNLEINKESNFYKKFRYVMAEMLGLKEEDGERVRL